MSTLVMFTNLPLYAKVAIEVLLADSGNRSQARLDGLLDAYAKTYGLSVDETTLESARHHCRTRFGDSYAE